MPVSGSDAADVAAEAVRLLQAFPDSARRFTATTEKAARAYALEVATVEDALRAGLPHRDETPSQVALVDPYDIHFIASRVATYLHRDGPAAEVDTTLAPMRVEYRIRRQRQLRGTAQCSVLTPDGRSDVAVDASTSVLWRGSVAHAGWDQPPPLPDPVRAILIRAARIEHRFLPPGIRGDVGIVRTTGIGDCTTVAALACEELMDAGVTARPAYGLQLAEPVSSTHSWIELRLGDAWVAVDPLMRGLTQRYRPGSAAWDVCRPIGGQVFRLAAEPAPVAVLMGQTLPVAFPSTLGRASGPA
jgi:Transglutaminase-like superfamily